MKREIISKRMIAFLIAFFMLATMAPFVTRTGVSHGASNWETEDNDSRSKADAITVNSTWYGKIGEDVYKRQVCGDSYIAAFV